MNSSRPAAEAVRLVLGFDAACVHCSRVAAAARDGARGRLEVMALGDAQMQAWLASAGREVTGRPVLVRIAEDGVSVFHGRMGLPLALVRQVGPRVATGILGALRSTAAGPESDRVGSGPGRSVSRRTMVGGLLGAWGLTAAAAAFGIPAAAAVPGAAARRYVPMSTPLADGELARLQQAPAVELASGRWGSPDWSTLQKGWSGRQDRVLYTVAFRDQELGATHLVTSGPVADDMPIAIRPVVRGENGTAVLKTYRPDGRPLVSVPLNGNGVDTARAVAPSPELFSTGSSGTASPESAPAGPMKAFIDCFVICLNANSAGDAAMPCLSCLNAGSPMEAMMICAQCYALAGDAFGQCSRECAGFM